MDRESPDHALAVERAKNARLLNLLRFVGLSSFYTLFLVLGGLLALPNWQGNLSVFSLYWALSGVVFFVSRRSLRVASATTLVIALVDLPLIFYLQWVQFPTSNPGGIAGFNVGIYVFLLLLGTLALERRAIFFTAMIAIVLEGLLQWLAGISPGAIVATAILIGCAAVACDYGSRRLRELVVSVARAEVHKGRSEKLAAIGQMAASIAHDLRNPLTTIGLASDHLGYLLERDRLEPAVTKESLEAIQRQVVVCTRISEGLLDIARERELALAPVPLAPLIHEVLSALAVRKPAHVDVQTAIPEDLPSPELDRDVFRQGLINLVQNAMEAAPAERAGIVTISAGEEAAAIVIRIADNGVGMTDAERARIFEPLYTTKSLGTGLGMAIVANVMRRHHAEMTVDSAKNRGTTFTIRVPLRAPA